MKLAFILEDESWFWIWNEETSMWEAWYESGTQVAVRLTHSDRVNFGNVLNIIESMRYEAQYQADIHA